MPHSVPLITTIAAALGLALILGFVAVRLKVPALVGYLVAGIVLGPATPGFVADLALSSQLAEIGVMLLMFGVGLHFSLEDLLAVRRIALPGALVQVVAVPDPFHVRRMIETARMVNPGIETVVRTHSDEEATLLRKEKAGRIFMGEHELAASMAGYVLELVAEPKG